jgi:hypothetical protein
MSINDSLLKIKQFSDSGKGKAIYYILLIILVAGSSFGLGRLSKISQSEGQVSIIYPGGNQAANAAQSVSKTISNPAPKVGETSLPAGSNGFVASSKGKKYYPVDCSAAGSLKESNKVFFSTEAAAKSAGYTRSSSCN